MPRLHSRREQPQQPAPPLENVWARCLASHTGTGGYVARGDQVRLGHGNVREYPDRFELAGPLPEWVIEALRHG